MAELTSTAEKEVISLIKKFDEQRKARLGTRNQTDFTATKQAIEQVLHQSELSGIQDWGSVRGQIVSYFAENVTEPFGAWVKDTQDTFGLQGRRVKEICLLGVEALKIPKKP